MKILTHFLYEGVTACGRHPVGQPVQYCSPVGGRPEFTTSLDEITCKECRKCAMKLHCVWSAARELYKILTGEVRPDPPGILMQPARGYYTNNPLISQGEQDDTSEAEGTQQQTVRGEEDVQESRQDDQ